jgi:hypothetical protein
MTLGIKIYYLNTPIVQYEYVCIRINDIPEVINVEYNLCKKGDQGWIAVSLLLNLEAARQGRSMLFSDEQKLLFKSGRKGFVKNTKLDFMRC